MSTARRRSPLLWIGSAVGAVVIIVVGVIIAVHAATDSSSSHSVETLKAVLDKVPLPAGAKLRREQADPEHGDANAFVEREYTLPASPQSSEQVRTALTRGDARLVDETTGQSAPLADADWSSIVTPTSGDLVILPPGTKGGGIEVGWKGTNLFVSVKGGDAELR